MAINIEWQVKPPSKNDDKPQMFPRITDSDRRMQSIVVRGVNFQPDQEFMDAIGKPTFQWKPTTGVAIAPTADQLIPQLLIYFKTHDSITREEFERIFGLKRTTAYMRLKELVKTGVIVAVGNGRETKYMNNNTSVNFYR